MAPKYEFLAADPFFSRLGLYLVFQLYLVIWLVLAGPQPRIPVPNALVCSNIVSLLNRSDTLLKKSVKQLYFLDYALITA